MMLVSVNDSEFDDGLRRRPEFLRQITDGSSLDLQLLVLRLLYFSFG